MQDSETYKQRLDYIAQLVALVKDNSLQSLRDIGIEIINTPSYVYGDLAKEGDRTSDEDILMDPYAGLEDIK